MKITGTTLTRFIIGCFTLCGAAMFCGLSPLYGQTTQEISLTQAVDIALSNNREMKAARSRAEQAKSKVAQAWSDLIPTIETSATAVRQGAESGINSMSDGSYDIRIIQASLFINPGVFYNTLQIASYENAYQREELRRIHFQVAADTIRAYFSVIRASELVKTRKDSQTQLKSNYADVQNLFRSGSVPRLDLLQAEIQYKNSIPLLMEAEQQMQAAIDNLNLVLGSENIRYDSSTAVIPSPGKLAKSDEAVVEILTQMALKNRPEIIELDIRGQQSSHAAAAQRSLYLWPTFFAQANFGYNRSLMDSQPAPQNPTEAAVQRAMASVAGNSDWQQTWQIRAGATYRWNGIMPFDKASQKEKEETLKAEEIALYCAQLKQSVGNAVRRNYLALKTARETIDIRRDTIATAEEGLRIARESYRAGIIKNSELLTAETTLSAARASYIDSLYNFYVSIAELTREAGTEAESIILEEVKP
jgi:outer membrane protein TolC